MRGCISCRVRRYERPPTATSIRHRPVDGGTAGATHGENNTRTDVRYSLHVGRTRREFATTAFATTVAMAAALRTGAASRSGGPPRPVRAAPGPQGRPRERVIRGRSRPASARAPEPHRDTAAWPARSTALGPRRSTAERTSRRTETSAGSQGLSLIHISEPTRQAEISYAVFC